MAYKTLIAWTDHTFNPWMGCHKVSPGCKNCYAETLVKNRMGKPDLWGANGVRQRTKGPWQKVRGWNREARAEQRPHLVFCASLADVFEDYPGPNEWRPDLWELIRNSPWLDFQILTKRPENIARMLPDDWGASGYSNVWLGTSIEDNRVADRGPILTSVPAPVHFVSYEPAVGPLDELDLTGIEWMIVGGESGPGRRHFDIGWAHDMKARCDEERVAFFFKQDAGPRTEMGIDAMGDIYRDYPLGWDRAAGRLGYRRDPQPSTRVDSEPLLAPSRM
jgi:protein gp37